MAWMWTTLTRAEVEARLQLWRASAGLAQAARLRVRLPGADGNGNRRAGNAPHLGGILCSPSKTPSGARDSPDVIAISSNPMPSYHGRRFFFKHEGFDIPYRSLVPQKIDGLVLAGRCISCEQAPFQSARSMAPAMADRDMPRAVPRHWPPRAACPPRRLDVKALQELLVAQKAELRTNVS